MSTIQAALARGRAQLHRSDSAALDARLLLQHILVVDHAHVIAHGDEPLAAAQSQAYEHLLDRAARGEPIPYLIGTAPFYGLDFTVTSDVLIPRPETEQLVERALRWAEGRPGIRIVDVGTGSGIIAVTLARHLPLAEVLAVDVSAAALEVARGNGERHARGRVRFMQSDLLAAVVPGVDLLVANLPYITDGEWPELEVGVQSFEPALALRGGPDGLELVRRLLDQALQVLNPEGMILLEIGWKQGDAARQAAMVRFPDAHVSVETDFAGHDRLVIIDTVGASPQLD